MSYFDYVTYKYVILKDVRLGVSYYLLALLIVIYTVVGIFYHKGYLEVNTELTISSYQVFTYLLSM